MKKTIALLLVLTLMLGALAGCRDKDKDDEPDLTAEAIGGRDAIRLLLASERLDAGVLKDSEGLFVSGAAAFENLYLTADANLVKYDDVSEASVTKYYASGTGAAGAAFSPDESHTVSGGGRFERDGNVYRWSDFGEYSNSYDYFLNLTNNVKSSAEIGADMIDDTKRSVRIVDKWVKIDGMNEILLHVEENSETIYRRGDGVQICRRYKRADGVNVYEIYSSYEAGSSMRMEYIPGEKCEYSYRYGSFEHNFLAENTKGFWEVVDVSRHEVHYNASLMVFKDDICYSGSYDPVTGEVGSLVVISPDKKTDIIRAHNTDSAAYFEISLQAFSGVDYVELVTDEVYDLENIEASTGRENFVFRYAVPSDPIHDEHTVYFSASSSCTLVTDNGSVVNVGDSFLGDTVSVNTIRQDHYSMEGYKEVYIASIGLNVQGDAYEARLDTLEALFAELGLRCTRDFTKIRAGITQAYSELVQMAKHHKWNESPIATPEGIDRGYENNYAKHAAFAAMLEALKDVPVIDYSDKELVALNIHFAPITAQSAASGAGAMSVSVTDLVLTVDDTTLFVEGDAYRVSFALAGENGLIPLADDGTASTVYLGEDSFRVSTTANVALTVPAEGSYTLVAYIATAEDAIRSTAYLAVGVAGVAPYTAKSGAVEVTTAQNASGGLVLTVVENTDVTVTVALGDAPTYADLYEALAAEAYAYGFVDEEAVLEVKNGDAWVAADGGDAPLASGEYRLAYAVRNGDAVKTGYVYTPYGKY